MLVLHKADVAGGKILVECHGPERCSVPLNQNRLSFLHSFYDLIESVFAVDSKGNIALIVGVAGSDNRYRKSFLAVFFHKEFLAGYFVAGVFPVWI